MRKRSKYKPKGIRLDNVRWVIDGMKPMSQASESVNLRLKNHVSLEALIKGTGTYDDVDVLIAAFNMTEALSRMRIGDIYATEIRGAQDALYHMGRRGYQTGRYLFTGPEMQAVRLGMEVHDAQLDACTVAELEKAIVMVAEEIRAKRARVIKDVQKQETS